MFLSGWVDVWMGGWVDVEVRYSEFGRAEMMCLPSLFHDDDL